MPRKKQKTSFSPGLIKFIVVTVLAIGLGWFLCNRIIKTFITSEYFQIKHVVVGPSLQFILSRDVEPFKGKNIFTIDIQKVEALLERKYPQASELRVLRRFPNRLVVEAKKRSPFVQVKVKNVYVAIDEKSVILATDEDPLKGLPLMDNTKIVSSEAILGGTVRSRDVRIGIQIQKSFVNYLHRANLSIASIDLSDLSKINVYLSNDLRIIMDSEKIDSKIQILSFVLTQKNLDFKDVKYIDLRFKEPILGRK